jgi:hypothetical protein
MQQLINYTKWLSNNQNRFFKEYLATLDVKNEVFHPKLDLNIQDIINYAYDLYEIPLKLRNLILQERKRESNELSNAKAMVVNYILNNNIKPYDYKTIYDKLFGYRTNRTTSLKAKNKNFKIEEPFKWNQFVKYIESNTVNWNYLITKENFFKLLSKQFKFNVEELYIKTSPGTKMNNSTIVKGLIIKYLKVNNLKDYKEITEIFKIKYTRSNCNFWKNKKLTKEYSIIYDFILLTLDKYTIIWT